MVQNFNPVVKTVTYQLNTISKYYELHTQPPGFNRMPKELQVQDSWCKDMFGRGAKQIIQGRTVNKKRTFFTGLRATPQKNIFFGDDGYTRPQNKSFILFQFNPDSTRLTVHYFPGFVPLKPMREQFIQSYLGTIL
jgi:hypothetical protein